MGQACGYICNKEGENNTYYFPDSESKDHSKKPSFTAISNQEFAKAMNKKTNDYDRSGYSSNTTRNGYDSIRTPDQLKKLFVNKFLSQKLVFLQALIRGHILRTEIKYKLAQNYEMMLRNNYEKFNVKKIEENERRFPEYKNPNSYITNHNFYASLGERKFFNKMLNENDSFYVGEVNLKNEKHGYGRLINLDGNLYQGNWVRNQFTGYGRMVDSKGILYEGNFENGLLTGKNNIIFNPFSNYKFEGEFLNGMKHGYGIEQSEEYVYEGNFSVDKKEGQGKIKYKLKDDLYEGNFCNDSIKGYGSYTWANKHVYIGNFDDGKMEGKGTYKWPTGEEYTGDYHNNIKMGMGVFRWPNGKIFEGPFINGNPNGEGKLIFDGKTINAKFIDGRLDSNSLNEKGPKFRRKNKQDCDKYLTNKV